MGQLIIEFSMPDDAAKLNGDSLAVHFGNGVRLVTKIPTWVKGINHTTLRLIMDVDGEPINANTDDSPIV